MSPAIKKYLTPASYIHRWKKIKRSRKVSQLEKRRVAAAGFTPLWKTKIEADQCEVFVGAFGIPADRRINWMKDVPGDQVFPFRRIDKIKMSEYYDRGYDVKYPWELSRFIFGSQLAASYAVSGKSDHYTRFRELVLNWIEGNPFLVGVNWICTMDVAIRATNWILASNVFAREIDKDTEFKEKLSRSLVQHGMYIHTFPEVYPGKHSTNHTTADYLGLLYVARAIPEHPESKQWQRAAVDGLISCMDYQVYDDGGSFEASAGYHRLVTELFGIGALLCLNQGIELPDSYYKKLKAMFGFLFCICDEKGNPPLFGDNDSGTLLQFDFSQNHNYAYMRAFYQQLFSGTGTGAKEGREYPFLALMPEEPSLYPVTPAEGSLALGLGPQEWRLFRESGIMAFRQGAMSGCVCFIPIGQNGRGGHNHIDMGSFTLFHGGIPLVVDPGTYTYTREFVLRNCYRAISCHNTVIPSGMTYEDFKMENLFELDPYCRVLNYSLEDERTFTLSYSLLDHAHAIKRKFQMEDDILQVRDTMEGAFRVKLHLGPEVEILETGPGLVRTQFFTLSFDPGREYELSAYAYAGRYQTMQRSQRLSIQAHSSATMKFDFNSNSNSRHGS